MAVICRNLKLLYICIPKTGSTSVSHFLIENLNGEWIPEKHVLNGDGDIIVDKKHSKVEELLSNHIISESELEQLHIFATVRNPFDLVLSNFFFERQIFEQFNNGITLRLMLGKSFYFLLRKIFKLDCQNHYSWIMNQADRYKFSANNPFEDYVKKFYSKKRRNMFFSYLSDKNATFIKQENLEEELSNFLKGLGITDAIHLPHLSKSVLKKDDYRTYYTEESKRIIEHGFKKELEYFNYVY